MRKELFVSPRASYARKLNKTTVDTKGSCKMQQCSTGMGQQTITGSAVVSMYVVL